MDGLKLVGIMVVSFFLIIGGLLLLLGTMCAFNGYQSTRPSLGAGLVWTFFLVLFLALGVMVIASLAKGIRTSDLTSLDLSQPIEENQKTSADRSSIPPDAQESK